MKKLLILFAIAMLTQAAWASVKNVSFTVDSTEVSQNSSYAYTFSIGSNGNGVKMYANVDTIYIDQPSFSIPSGISTSRITVENTNPAYVDVRGNTIAILTPVDITSQSTIVNIVISAAANITNPSTAGDYTVSLYSNHEATPVSSNTQTITAATSTVTSATVNVNPSIAGEAAAYTISFNVGSSGALSSGSGTVTIKFDTATYVPNAGLSGVTLNSTSATANAAGDSVIITSPVNIGNNDGVTIAFAAGSGLMNPAQDSSYTLQVYTSAESTPVTSENYTISPAGHLSITAITTYPDTVNMNDDFVMNFRTGSSGALSAGSDTIYVKFPANTYLPSNMTTNGITVESGGFSDNPAEILIDNGNSSDDDTLYIIPNINIGNNADVTVSIFASTGFLSPSIAGSFVISLQTSAESPYVDSNPGTIFATTSEASLNSITPGDASTSAVTSYTISFTTGRYGRLMKDSSKVTLTFDSNFGISETMSDYNNSKFIVGTDTASLSSAYIAPDNTNHKIVVKVPATAAVLNNTTAKIVLDGTTTDPITNPGTNDNYPLELKTSVETTPVSKIFNIGGTAITINSVTLTNSVVNNTTGYTFNITIQNDLQNVIGAHPSDPDIKDQVIITFPDGVSLPSSIATTNASIDGDNPETITVNTTDRKVTLTVSNTINAPGPFNVVISSAAGIVNPIVPSTTYYDVIMYTTTDLVPVTSSAYSITGGNTSVTPDTSTLYPSVVNATDVKYVVGFTTGVSGKIAGGKAAGSSEIYLDFDTGTIVPSSISASHVKVNDLASSNVSVLSSGAGGQIKIALGSQIIGNSTAVSVVIDTSAGMANSSSSGAYNISAHTSSDTVDVNIPYTLSAAQALSFTSVTPSPAKQNDNASYSIKFTTGSSGSLAVGDTITLVFPDNTYLPSNPSKSDILVNSNALTVDPGVSGDTLRIKTPVSINNLTSVTVSINGAAGFLNPTNIGSYTVKLFTSSESGPYTSPSYSITATTTTVSAATVTPANALTDSVCAYTINFDAGDNGRLISGSSTIIIKFNASTTVSANLSDYSTSTVSVNSGTATAISTIAVNGQEVTVTVPSGVSVDNNDNIKIILSGATDPITNPASAGSYTLDVKTSVETTYISSSSYAISDLGPVDVAQPFLSTTEANATADYRIEFVVGNPGGSISIGGTITAYFPNNTYIPTTISTNNVEIRNGATLSGSTPSNPSNVSTNPSARSITLTTSATINEGDSVRVEFFTGAGLENPSVAGAGTYQLDVATSSQTIQSSSPTYSITASTTSITINTITISKDTPSTQAQYSINFTTGSNGRLLSGTSYIDLIFPVDVTFSLGTPPTSKVRINSTAAKSVTLFNGNSSDDDTLRAVVPSSVTVGNGSSVTVVIDSTAGFTTPSSTVTKTYGAYTSVETTIQTQDHSLPVELSTFSVEASGSKAMLTWATESELDNILWVVEKKELNEVEYRSFQSGDLEQEKIFNGYEEVTNISGSGTTANRSEYRFIDSTVVAGHYYLYRLADVDYSGKITRHLPVAVEIALPEEFQLSQNYPNPFNPSTTIRFRLPEKSTVSLIIYNVLGQEVLRLANKTLLDAGEYTYRWDGVNKTGTRVASGMYFYRINAGAFTAVRKMILIR